MNTHEAQATDASQKCENGPIRPPMPPDLRATIIRALTQAILAEIRGEK